MTNVMCASNLHFNNPASMILFPLACFHVFIASNDIQTRMKITLRKIHASSGGKGIEGRLKLI
jgi:hypothetical protein